MPNEPNVTVVITCFNLSRYIKECIESVLAQTYSGSITILIGDDASIDNSVELIKALQIKNESIILVERQENIGTAANVIDLYRRVDTPYITHLDGDDLMLDGRLRTTVSFLEKHQDIDLVGCELKRFNDQDDEYCGFHYQDHYQKRYFEAGFTLATLVEYGSFLLPSSLTFRTHLISELQYVAEILVIDDYMRHLQLMASARKGGILFTPLTLYRVREDGSTGLMQSEQKRRIQSMNDMVLARKMVSNKEGIDSELVNRGISGEYFAAALFFLRLEKFTEFQLCLTKSAQDNRRFYSFKHRIFYMLRHSPSTCQWLFTQFKKYRF